MGGLECATLRGRVWLLKLQLSSALSEHVPQDQEPCCVICPVLDVFDQHISAVVLRRKATGNRTATLFGVFGDDLASFRSGRDILSLDAFKVFPKECLTLAPRLRVRVQFGYRAIVFGPAGI